MTDERVVITGCGALSCVGSSVESMWDALLAGQSGITTITRFDAKRFRTRFGGELKGFNSEDYISKKESRRQDLFCQYAVGAADQAIAQSGIDPDSADSPRIGVLIGSGIGGILTFEDQCRRYCADDDPGRVSPFLIPMLISDMASGYVAMRYNFTGPNFGIVSACATGTHAIGEAMWMIRRGDADVMLAGGAEACISAMAIAGFCSMRAMSTRNDDPEGASRPFDAGRDGFVIAEGAGVLVLESETHARARGAQILAELAGYGASADAHHITAPHPEGAGAAKAIVAAMGHAELNAEDIDYINAHGTSTPLNDKYETMALKTTLSEHAYKIAVSSTKSLTGHTLGAAGGLETIICVQAIQHGVVPGTYNYEDPDPDCDLNYVPNKSIEMPVRTALNLNFGFGGHNAVLAIKAYGNNS